MRKCALLIPLFFFTLFTGCGPSKHVIEGSVFVATRGGENFKLALVPICIIPANEYDNARKAFLGTFQDEIAELDKNKQSYDENINKIIEIRSESANYDRLKAQFDQIDNEAKANRIYIYSNVIHYVYEEDYQKACDYQPRIEHIVRLMNASAAKLGALKSQYLASEAIVNSACDQKDKIEARYTDRTRQFIAYLISKYGVQARSDADGKFKLVVLSPLDYVIVGMGERSIGDTVEKYNWVAKVKGDSNSAEASVFLSNDELVNGIEGDGSLSQSLAHYVRGYVEFPEQEEARYAVHKGAY